MSIFAIYNQKGGVGKTTTVLNLAASFAGRGNKTYAIDLDPQANLTEILNVLPASSSETVLGIFEHKRALRELLRPARNGIEFIPAHMHLARADMVFGKGYDIVNRLNTALHAESLGSKGETVLIDCSPMIGVLALNAIFAADCVIVPVAADHLSANAAFQIDRILTALEPVMKRRISRRYLVTRFDKRRRMAWEVLRQLESRFGNEVCRTCISEDVRLAESPARKMAVFDCYPNCAGALDYKALTEELTGSGLVD